MNGQKAMQLMIPKSTGLIRTNSKGYQFENRLLRSSDSIKSSIRYKKKRVLNDYHEDYEGGPIIREMKILKSQRDCCP